MEREKVIIVKNLYKSFLDKHVLRGINDAASGENLGIMKSGIGKSVLTKCIVRLIKNLTQERLMCGNDVLRCNDRTE